MNNDVVNKLGSALQTVAQAAEKPQEFVQRLMVAKCDKGTLKYQYLNLPKDHGVYFQDLDHPLMNANDHKADRHILQFGRCTAETNPKNVAGKVLSSTIPLFAVLDKAKSAMGCDGCKCSPKTLKVWEETNEGNCLDGANGILNTSHAMCCYGGFIEITQVPASEKSEDKDQSGEEAASRKPIEEQLPAAMAEKINSLNPTEDSEGESDTAAEDAAGESTSSADSGGNGTAPSGGAGNGGFPSGSTGSGDSPSGVAEDGTTPGEGIGNDSVEADNGMGEVMSALTDDMNQWYAQVQDFPQNYGVSEAVMRSNYANNMCMSLPGAALNDGGYICDMGELSAFRMGGSSAALIGGSCVAAYNLLNAIGLKPNLGRLIMSAERQQTIPGYMDQGPMAVSMLSTKNTLSSLGVSTKPMNPAALMKAARTPNTTAILATAKTGGKAEYHTLKSDSKGTLRCLERSADVSALLGKQKGVVKMALVVRK